METEEPPLCLPIPLCYLGLPVMVGWAPCPPPPPVKAVNMSPPALQGRYRVSQPISHLKRQSVEIDFYCHIKHIVSPRPSCEKLPPDTEILSLMTPPKGGLEPQLPRAARSKLRSMKYLWGIKLSVGAGGLCTPEPAENRGDLWVGGSRVEQPATPESVETDPEWANLQ